ncbi:hypothetical protein FRC01_004566 [Tulasnella sp. 417]|nr:hypothetical protein FRC01_004566 [Tulasnella sp. 417]
MSSFNDLVLQLQLFRAAAPSGTVPVQAAVYLSIAFGRPQEEACTDKELTTCSTYLDHSSFIRTLRRLLPLDEQGTRSGYTGLAPRSDLSDLLKIFGRDPIEVEDYMNQYVPEHLVALAKFLRILAKPIAGQRYPIGVYTISRPLAGAPTKVFATVTKSSCRRDRAKGALGMPVARDAVALALARRMKYQKYRANLIRHRTRRNSDSTESTASGVDIEDRDRDLNVLSFRLCGLNL